MKVGKAIYNILSQSTDVQSNFPFNTTDYSPTGTELVENGEFDQLGTDVITNGSFATDTDWTKGNGWSIGDNKATSTQALGSEEVTNGDFSAAGINLVDNPNFTDTGIELVTNGDFTSASGWNINSNWSIDTVAGTISSDGTNTNDVNQALFPALGNSYKVEYTISAITQGSYKITFGGITTALEGSVGTHTYYITAIDATGYNARLRIGLDNNTIGTISNVSVKELGADWTVTNADATHYVEFIETGARFVLPTTSPITELAQSTFTLLANKSYKLTVDMTAVSGGVKMDAAGVSETFNATTSGTNNTRYIYPTSNTSLAFYRASTNVDLTFHSVSVQELGEGWNVQTGWSIGEDKAICDGSTNNALKQVLTLPIGNLKITFTIEDFASGDLNLWLNLPAFTNPLLVDENGDYEVYVTTTSGANNIYFYSVAFIGSVTNVSIKEIATSYLTQAVSLSAKTWKIIYSVSDYIAGSVSATDYGAVTTANAVGITEYVEIGVASDFRMVNIDGYFEGAVTDISAQLVDPNGYWTLGSGWSFGDDVAISDGSAGSITQSILTANTSYKITVKVTGNPTLLVFSSTSFYGDEATRTLKNGTHTYYLQAKAATFSITNEGGDACTVTNISVEEVVLNKIFPELAPPDIDAPYIVYSVVSNSPSETKNNNGDIDTASIEVYGFQDTYNKAVDLGVSVRAALDRKTGTYNTIEIQSTNYVNEQMDVNEARKLWAAIQDYSIRIKNL